MTRAPLRIVGVGSGDAMRTLRADERFDLVRSEDAIDALALCVSASPAPNALVFDTHAAAREDMDRVIDAALKAGLPVPIVLETDFSPNELLRALDEDHTPHEPSAAEALLAIRALADASQAILEGDSALETLVEGCASFGVHIVAPDAELPSGHASVAIEDEDGAAIALLVAPASLEPMLTPLARACTGFSDLDDAIEDLLEDASTDPDTGLPDRATLLEELEARIDDCRPDRRPFTLTLVRIDPDAMHDPEIALDLADQAEFGAVASWGVLGLIREGDGLDDELPEGPIAARASVLYPWDGADAQALLNHAEEILLAMVRTDSV